jgi:hypothetical protein
MAFVCCSVSVVEVSSGRWVLTVSYRVLVMVMVGGGCRAAEGHD